MAPARSRVATRRTSHHHRRGAAPRRPLARAVVAVAVISWGPFQIGIRCRTNSGAARLNAALGTLSSDFVNASLLQLQAAARSPYGKISETAINAALAMIEAAAPKDELEGALAIQMACAHTAAMAVLAKIDSGLGTERRIVAFGSTAARLMKTYAMQMEVLRRLRNGGQQFVRVEHVHINDGGQAVIGNVRSPNSAG